MSHGYLLRVLFRGKTVRKRSRARTVILDFPFFLNARIIVFSHANRTRGFMAVFCKSKAVSAHAGSKFLAMFASKDSVSPTLN